MKAILSGDRVFYKPRGRTYTFVGAALLEAKVPLKGTIDVVVYKNEERELLCVLPTKDFYNGNFEKIEDETK